jgi:hypothetical protein
MTCPVNYYTGAGECKNIRQTIIGAIIMEKSAVITKANAKTLAGWKAIVAAATPGTIAGVILDFRNGAEPSGGENELTTANTNFTVLTNRSNIILDGYANMSFLDYQNFFGFEGKSFKIVLIDKNGDLVETNKSATNVTGFRGQFWLVKAMPKVGADRQKTYHFHIEFTDINEWGANENVIDTFYDAVEILEDVNPVGLNLEVKTAYAVGGDVVVKVTKRGTLQPYAELDDAADWVIRSSTDDVGVTVTVKSSANKSLGEYTLTIKNGTPADLVGSVDLQAFTVATNITHISNVIKISL